MTRYKPNKDHLNTHKRTPAIAGIRVSLAILCFSFIAVFSSFGSSVAQLYGIELDEASAVPSSLHIKASVDHALRVGKVSGQSVLDRQTLHEFYEARHFEPYWMSDTGPYGRAHQFIETVQQAWTHGLNPETYHASKLRDLVDGARFLKKNELEVLLTDSFVRYARDLSGIRVDPSGLKTDAKSWQQPMSVHEALSYLQSGQPMSVLLRQIQPQGSTYKKLQEELVRLINEEEKDYASVLPIAFRGVLRPGERHDAVPSIRTRLGVSKQGADEFLYDDALTVSVIRFQREHDLGDDGIIGSNTLQIMNRTNRTRIEQIIANLERLRWVKKDRPDRFVVVNIPAATLWAVDKGRVDFEMPVIVGKPVRATQSFISEIQGVRFNPDWTIPPTIKRFDILPKMKEDPSYLHSKGINLLRGHGKNAISLDPHAIEWDGISARELNSLRMVQMPGDNNPLGRVRVLMPNVYNIYLHDTNHPEYFSKPSRALSSGCIRLKHPEKMAQFILRNEPQWSRSAMQPILDSGKKTELFVSDKMPVYVLYYTAWTDSDGRVVYGSDIYKQDSKLIAKLSDIDGFYIPRHTEVRVASSGRSRHNAVNQ